MHEKAAAYGIMFTTLRLQELLCSVLHGGVRAAVQCKFMTLDVAREQTRMLDQDAGCEALADHPPSMPVASMPICFETCSPAGAV